MSSALKRLFIFTSLALALICVQARAPMAQADDAETPAADQAAEHAAEHVERARRLREFGYPLLARTQLDHARKLDPTSKRMLIEYLRLHSQGVGNAEDYVRFATTLRDLYPNDYDSCLEIAWWLYWVEDAPTPPAITDSASLRRALDRLDAEMIVYRALASWIAKPEGDLPAQATGRPALPLAYLARCIKARPGDTEATHLAALDLDRRGRDFQHWSTLFDPDPADELESAAHRAFALAAQEVYELTLPLLRRSARSDEYYMSASVMLANLLLRMGKHEDAAQAIVTAELAQPGNVRVAQTRLALAEQTQDFDALEDALVRLHNAYLDHQSDLDLRALRRIRKQGHGFGVWLAWSELQSIRGLDRTGAIRAMLQEFPEFDEVYYLDALNAFEFARMTQDLGERQKLLIVVLQALEAGKGLSEEFADWHRLQADALWMLGEYEQAAESYKRVATLDPKDPEAPRHAAAARDIAAGVYSAHDYGLYRHHLDETGDLREKRAALQDILTRSPKFFEAQVLLGKVATVISDFEVAYGAYAKAHELQPESVETLYGLARAAQHTGRFAQALKFFDLLTTLAPNDAGAARMAGIMRWVVDGGRERGEAFKLWLQSMSETVDQTKRRRLLEEATLLEPEFAEVLVELAAIERTTRREAADIYLTRALRHARDDDTRAAVHRQRGQMRLAQLRYNEAITEFETAYTHARGDGTDLLLAALAHRELGDFKASAAAMRRLFAENSDTLLLRPRLRDVEALDVDVAPADGFKQVHPDYDVGAKLTFGVRIEVDSEGGGSETRALVLEFTAHLEVIEKPLHTGLWVFKLTFSDVPPAAGALGSFETVVKISPWFGLLEDTVISDHAEVLNPVLQGLAEAFTLGLGDAPIAPPYIWRKDLTVGPPRFRDAAEASWISKAHGDHLEVRRRALAGRQLGMPGDDQHNFSRALEARVTVNGRSRAIDQVEQTILRKELTAERDDVTYGRLYLRLTAR